MVRRGYVLLRIATGPGVKVILQDLHRHCCTISSFFLRVPRLVRLRPPQRGQASGSLAVSGTRAMRGIGADIPLIVCGHRTMRPRQTEAMIVRIPECVFTSLKKCIPLTVYSFS